MAPKPSPAITFLTPADTLPQRQKDLPLETLLTIIHMLAKPELVRCCRVSQFFNFVALPHLYKELHIDLAKPGIYATLPAVVPGESQVLVGSREGSPAVPLNENVHQPEAQEVPRSDLQLARFSFTTYLTITPHSQSLCNTIPPLDLPNLITLRMTGCEPSLSATLAATCPDTICPFLARLRPRRVVVSTDVAPHLPSMTRDRCYPPDSATELVILVDPSDDIDLASCVRGVNPSVEHLTLVVRPGPRRIRAVASHPVPDLLEPVFRSRKQARTWSEGIAEACWGEARQITVVGLKWDGSDALGLKMLPDQLKTRAQRALVQKGMNEKDAASRVEWVKSVDLADYDGEV